MHCCGSMNSWIHTQSKETNQNYLAMHDFVLKLCVHHLTQNMYGHKYSSKFRSLIWPTKSSKIGLQWIQSIRNKYCSVSLHWFLFTFTANESWRFGALKSDSTHHFFRNAYTKSGSLRFHSFSVVDWFCLSIYWWVLTFPW